ncbi:MAG: asparagine synthase-related protein [Fimbriimonadales bacterium]
MAASIRAGDGKTIKGMLSTAVDGKIKPTVLSKNGMVLGGSGEGTVPFESADGSKAIVFSGDLYNADKLKPFLKPAPKSDSHAEIVLGLYKLKGRKCVHYLDGPFSFVIVDGHDFYAARDPLGVKPFYFAKNDGGWLFASELKAFGPDVKKVSEFPPGCYLASETGARRYFKIPEPPTKHVNLTDAVEMVRVLVGDSIEKRISPHGDVGIYLTGTLESCIIAALAAQKVKRIKTFSVGLAGSQDGHTAKRVASWLNTDHKHVEVSEQEVVDSIQGVVHGLESFDAGLVRHAVADYFATREASQHVKSLISSDGANELFGGYAYLRPMFSEKLANELRAITQDLHKTNLLRWERMTSMFGIEARMPFVDRKLVHAAFHLPANLKINEEGRSKWILRRAFSTLLPAWVVDRPDNDDTFNAGITMALEEYAGTVFTDEDLSKEKKETLNLRTKDELLYFQIWRARFPSEYVHLVGRTQL